MNRNRKVHIVLGTKAQLIKMAPLMAIMEKRNIPYNFIFTGQHKETIDDLRENFSIKKPDITLHDGKDITSISSMFFWSLKILFKSLTGKRKIFGITDKDDIVLVHGDTFSTLLGALMGKIAGLKVGHVESGLRSFNIFNPFPEELTRILTFKLSDFYFCPGLWAMENLKKEKGIKFNIGENTLMDALVSAKKAIDKTKVDIPKEKYCICTIHRFENIFKKNKLREIMEIVEEAAEKLKVLFILHLPTKKQLEKFGLMTFMEKNKNIELRPRYGYFEFIKLSEDAEFLISDGGSNQEEAYYMNKPILLLRNKTERQEGIGENALLSEFNRKLVSNFFENYRDFKLKGKNKFDHSPSGKILEYIFA